jgi:LmbE family N-acetylglucosaminyl deacetylase
MLTSNVTLGAASVKSPLGRTSIRLRVILALLLFGPAVEAQTSSRTAGSLGTTARVLLVATRPEDEDNALIAWLSLGHDVETAYLSLTRGESGVNVNGSERQSALAVVRTAELLAERGRDGAHQYFTRAYDFGSPTADSVVDARWPRDSLLRDVVSVIRAFRPHVIILLDAHSGADTLDVERDATRRLTSRLAREAFTLAADTIRLPSRATSRLPAWSVSRLYTRVDTAPDNSRTTSVDVGEFDLANGRTYAEIGFDIRKLQRSQPAPVAPHAGPGFGSGSV